MQIQEIEALNILEKVEIEEVRNKGKVKDITEPYRKYHNRLVNGLGI